MADSDARLFAAIRRIVHGVDRHSKYVERIAGITLPQLAMLRAIHALGKVTTGRLSAAVSLSPATVTTILDNLEEAGLVLRYRNTADRRVVHSQLTERGARILAAAPPFLDERFAARFAALGEARKAEILRALEEVAELLAPLDAPAAAEPPLARPAARGR